MVRDNREYAQAPEIPALTQAQIDIGKLETEVQHLTTSVENLRQSMSALEGQMREVLAALSEAKGGWRMLMLLGGAGAAVGAAVSWAVTHLTLKGLP